MNRFGMIFLCAAAFTGGATAIMADEQTTSSAPQVVDAPAAAIPDATPAPVSAQPAAAQATGETDATGGTETEDAPVGTESETPTETAAPAPTAEPESTPASVPAPAPAQAPTQVAITQMPAPLSPAAPVAAVMQDPKLATYIGQWKLNDGSTTTGIVQVTNSGKDVTMTVVQETRYRVDWTLFGPPFPTNWPLLQGKVDDEGKVAWTYYDTVPGCWTNKAVPVTPTVTADQRRVDFQVATFKAITCQPDDKAPTMAFKLTRQP